MALICFSRLDHSLFGRSLEKADASFISYASFIYMECLHTHPVLIYFTSIVQEQIEERDQYRRVSKRDMNFYTHHQRIIFRWWLAITLSRNQQLIAWRKHHIQHPLSRRVLFPSHPRTPRKNRELLDTSVTFRNHATTCTTLLLDMDEQDDRKPSF